MSEAARAKDDPVAMLVASWNDEAGEGESLPGWRLADLERAIHALVAEQTTALRAAVYEELEKELWCQFYRGATKHDGGCQDYRGNQEQWCLSCRLRILLAAPWGRGAEAWRLRVERDVLASLLTDLTAQVPRARIVGMIAERDDHLQAIERAGT